jgi:hypothetical protein
MKICSKCKIEKPEIDFNKNQGYCKDCGKQYRKQWYQDNKQHHNQLSKQWRRKNKEHRKQYNKQWYHAAAQYNMWFDRFDFYTQAEVLLYNYWKILLDLRDRHVYDIH